MICVDARKKELVGQVADGGQPVAAHTRDFPQDSAGKAVPCGVYDITGNTGGVPAGHRP